MAHSQERIDSMQRNHKIPKTLFKDIQYHSPVLCLLIISFNYTRQPEIFILQSTVKVQVSISSLQSESTLKHTTWLNSLSSQTDTEIKHHPKQQFRIKSLRWQGRGNKKAISKDIIICKETLETCLTSWIGVVGWKIWDQYHPDIAEGACRDKRRKSYSYFISIIESQNGSEVKENCSWLHT